MVKQLVLQSSQNQSNHKKYYNMAMRRTSKDAAASTQKCYSQFKLAVKRGSTIQVELDTPSQKEVSPTHGDNLQKEILNFYLQPDFIT